MGQQLPCSCWEAEYWFCLKWRSHLLFIFQVRIHSDKVGWGSLFPRSKSTSLKFSSSVDSFSSIFWVYHQCRKVKVHQIQSFQPSPDLPCNFCKHSTDILTQAHIQKSDQHHEEDVQLYPVHRGLIHSHSLVSFTGANWRSTSLSWILHIFNQTGCFWTFSEHNSIPCTHDWLGVKTPDSHCFFPPKSLYQ